MVFSLLDMAILRLQASLRGTAAWKTGEYSIFGSTALILREIIDREPGDIDVFVSRRIWGELLASPSWVVETPNAGDPPILSLKGDIDLNLFFAWRDPMVEIDAEDLIARSELVETPWGSWKLAPVADVLYHKEQALSYGSAAVQKHRPDIAACRIHLGLDPVVET